MEIIAAEASVPQETHTQDKISEAVLVIARKAHLAASSPDRDFIYELARAAVSYVAGPSAVHDIAEWKTTERYEWALDKISEALKS